MTGLDALASKFPASFAAFDAAAMTDGSSMAMGMRYSFPLILKFVAKPKGRGKTPKTFSIMRLAVDSSRLPKFPNKSVSSEERPADTAISSIRFCGVFFLKSAESFIP